VASRIAPFDRDGLGRKVLPFAIFAIAAEMSIALPLGPKSATWTILSVALLFLVGAAFFLPWERLPETLTVTVPITYAVQVLFMTLAAGGSSSGIGIVILIPLVWTVLYHRRWESFVVVLTIVVVEVITSLTPIEEPGAVLFRRILFWSAMGFLISVAAHGLRDRIERTIAARDEQYRRSSSLVEAAGKLAATLSPYEVLSTATRLAADLASPPDTPARRAQYARIDREVDGKNGGEELVRIVVQYDEAGESVTDTFDLSEHPVMTELLRTGEAIHRDFDPENTGPKLRKVIESLGVTHMIYVPVRRDGAIDGVLTVPIRGFGATEELFEHCKALGKLTELALSNALAHDEIRQLATTDALTGLTNLRGFEENIENRPGRRPFAILAMDVDGLKKTNDNFGHAAGDALLVHIAATVKQAMRRGDVLARLGGDEFAAFLVDADEPSARRVAERMLQSLSRSRTDGRTPRLSVGLAFGFHDSEVSKVREAADAAMYLAKRLGGSRYEVASSVLDAELVREVMEN
jgi:diguanylate cyclase (GGDEF)-like protein